MSDGVASWAVSQEQGIYASQRSQVDAAKVLVGLTLAVAATLVGTTLQVAPNSGIDVTACWLLAFTVLFSVATIGFDSVDTYDREKLERKDLAELSGEELAEYVRHVLCSQNEINQLSLRYVRSSAYIQVAFAVAAGIISVVSLLGGSA